MTQGVEAVEKALKTLLLFRREDRAISLAEISKRTGFHKSTILRFSKTLCECGFLIRQSNGMFRLGPTLLHLGSLYKASFRLEEVIVPALRELVEATRETARFYIREGKMRTCLFRVDSPELLREHIVPGQLMPIDSTSIGQVFQLMESELPVSESVFPIFTAGIRDPLTASCAAPLITSTGTFLGVMTVSGPQARFTLRKRRKAGRKLMEVLQKLSMELGGISFDVDNKNMTHLENL